LVDVVVVADVVCAGVDGGIVFVVVVGTVFRFVAGTGVAAGFVLDVTGEEAFAFGIVVTVDAVVLELVDGELIFIVLLGFAAKDCSVLFPVFTSAWFAEVLRESEVRTSFTSVAEV
jgi:hypothetical protein